MRTAAQRSSPHSRCAGSTPPTARWTAWPTAWARRHLAPPSPPPRSDLNLAPQSPRLRCGAPTAWRLTLTLTLTHSLALSLSLTLTLTLTLTLALTRSAHRAALSALGASASSVRSGGALPYFMLYDVCVTLLVALLLGCVVVSRGLLSRLDARGQPSLWLFWENVALAREAQALLSFPFVIFLLPMTLRLLTHVQPTGYDKSGLLCQALTSTQIRLMRKHRARRQADSEAPARRYSTPVLDAGLDIGAGLL